MAKTQPINPDLFLAKQWFKHGDNKFVEPCRALEVDPDYKCPACGKLADASHGIIRQGGDGLIVCPGNWIVSNDDGTLSIYSDRNFKRMFRETADPVAEVMTSDGYISEDAAAWRFLLETYTTLEEFRINPDVKKLDDLRRRIDTFLKTLPIGEKKHERKK